MTMIPTFKPTSGVGSTRFQRPQDSRHMMDYKSSHIIYYFDDENRIHIAKNRFTAITGDIDLDSFIDISLEIISNKAYSDSSVVFQEGLKAEMKEAIGKIFKKNFLEV